MHMHIHTPHPLSFPYILIPLTLSIYTHTLSPLSLSSSIHMSIPRIEPSLFFVILLPSMAPPSPLSS